MTRDYAKSNRPAARRRNTRLRPSRSAAPGWVWMIAGVLIGALAMGIIRFNPPPTEERLPASPAPQEELPATDSDTHKPRFDFYTLLKETEVIVPEQDGGETPQPVAIPADREQQAATGNEADAAEKKATGTATPASPDTSSSPSAIAETEQGNQAQTDYQTVYVLQAGSFKQAADADSVRARLLLLNLQASIEKVTTNNNETWHRVLIGPFDTQAESSEVRKVLTRNGIDSIQLKRRL